MNDEFYMRHAAELARRALGETTPNPIVGAVIVRNGEIIGEGWHHKAGCPHAEIEAIRSANGANLEGSTIYVTLEPCSSWGRTPPCTDAVLREKFARVVIGCPDPNPKHAGRAVELLRRTTPLAPLEVADALAAMRHCLQGGQEVHSGAFELVDGLPVDLRGRRFHEQERLIFQ